MARSYGFVGFTIRRAGGGVGRGCQTPSTYSSMRELTSTYSVGVKQVGSSCGQPGEENSNTAANKWLMVAIPPLLRLTTHTKVSRGFVIQNRARNGE